MSPEQMKSTSEEVKKTSESDVDNDAREKKQGIKDKYDKPLEYDARGGDTDTAPNGPDAGTVYDDSLDYGISGHGDADTAPNGPDVGTVYDDSLDYGISGHGDTDTAPIDYGISGHGDADTAPNGPDVGVVKDGG